MLQVTRLFKYPFPRTHFLGFFEEEPDRLFEIPQGFLLRTTAGRDINLSRVCNEGPAFLENLSGELESG